jgi:hypothetical protein
MTTLVAEDLQGSEIKQDLFGVNFLFDSDTIEEGDPYPAALENVGVNLVRYPGGAITERFFDITDPDRSTTYDVLKEKDVELVPLTDFLSFASENGLAVNIVLPTNGFLTVQTDENGDRFADFNHDELTTFVEDVLAGSYGDATIKSFEIGNEYWGSGGMSAVEYGRLASEMSGVIDNAIVNVSVAEDTNFDTEIIVQSGTNFLHSRLTDDFSETLSGIEILDTLTSNYGVEFDENTLWSTGDVNWSYVNDQLIADQFNSSQTMDNVDGVVAHIYSKGSESLGSRDAFLKQIDENWGNDEDHKDIHITEWNQKSGTDALVADEDYGLLQAHEILNIVESFSEFDVEAAYAWPLSQNTRTALSYRQDDGELSPPGEMFRMMSENLVGTRPIGLLESNLGETEQSIGEIDAHSFWGNERLVFYFASTSETDSTTFVDLSGLLSDFDTGSARRLGVADGENPTNSRSDAVVEELQIDQLYEDGILDVVLGPFEIFEVVFEGTELTIEAQEAFGGIDVVSAPAVDNVPIIDDLIPIIDDPIVPVDEVTTDEDNDDSGLFEGLEMLLLIPLLGAFTMALG